MSVLHLTQGAFDKAIGEHSVAMVDFWAGWCGPCKMLAPTIETFSISIAPREQGRILVQTIYHYLYHGKPPAADWIKVPITIAIDENVDSLEADFGPRDMG